MSVQVAVTLPCCLALPPAVMAEGSMLWGAPARAEVLQAHLSTLGLRASGLFASLMCLLSHWVGLCPGRHLSPFPLEAVRAHASCCLRNCSPFQKKSSQLCS